jgi:hypothetical protein
MLWNVMFKNKTIALNTDYSYTIHLYNFLHRGNVIESFNAQILFELYIRCRSMPQKTANVIVLTNLLRKLS